MNNYFNEQVNCLLNKCEKAAYPIRTRKDIKKLKLINEVKFEGESPQEYNLIYDIDQILTNQV
jgi:hypothetical protein